MVGRLQFGWSDGRFIDSLMNRGRRAGLLVAFQSLAVQARLSLC